MENMKKSAILGQDRIYRGDELLIDTGHKIWRIQDIGIGYLKDNKRRHHNVNAGGHRIPKRYPEDAILGQDRMRGEEN